VPDVLVPQLVSARTWVRRLNKARWAAAQDEIRFLLGDDIPEAELKALAHRQLWRSLWRSEAIFHPELVTTKDVLGEQHLRDALSEGRGCLLSVIHHADYESSVGALAKRGYSMQVMVTTGLFDDSMSNVMRLERELIAHGPGVELFNVTSGSGAIRERLQSGHCVVVAIDPPGRTRHHFFGRDVWMSSGGVHAAWEIDAPVMALAQTPEPGKRRKHGKVNLSRPLFPHDFDTVEDLMREVIRVHELAVLEWPEAAAWNWPFQFEKPVGPRKPN
jgi:lauroyl/myristoyl acyltransferase